jgi:hypothetical protein
LSKKEKCGGQRCDAQEFIKDTYKFYLEKMKENNPFRGVTIILYCNTRKVDLV